MRSAVDGRRCPLRRLDELNVDRQLIGIDGCGILQAIEDFYWGTDPKAPMNKCVEPDKEALVVALEDDVGLLASCRRPCSQTIWMAEAPVVSVWISQLGERDELIELRGPRGSVVFRCDV
jgi:hypothetical protein